MPCMRRSSNWSSRDCRRTCWWRKCRSRRSSVPTAIGAIMLPSGRDATAPHLTWDDRPFKKGEGTFFEIGGCYRRYHAPLSRTVYLGRPPQKFLDAEKAVLEATEAGLAKAKPGNSCEDVAI